jgi:hypothetical protein
VERNVVVSRDVGVRPVVVAVLHVGVEDVSKVDKTAVADSVEAEPSVAAVDAVVDVSHLSTSRNTTQPLKKPSAKTSQRTTSSLAQTRASAAASTKHLTSLNETKTLSLRLLETQLATQSDLPSVSAMESKAST